MKSLFLALLLLSCGRPPIPADPSPLATPSAEQPAGPAISSETLTITILDVGQGDAALLQTPSGETILIDAGPPGAGRHVILPALAAAGITALAFTIASHYDLDHIGGLAEVFDGADGTAETADDFLPTRCFDRGGAVPDNSSAARAYAARRTPCHQPVTPGMAMPLGEEGTLTVLAVNGWYENGTVMSLDPADENAHSIALLLRYRNFTYLTAGDLPGGGGAPPYTTIDLETPLLPLLPRINVLHTSHHGSHTATSEGLLTATQPEAAMISVGNANPHGHPHPSVLQRLTDAKIPIYLTERGDQELPDGAVVKNGPVVITTDGEGFTIE